MQERLAACEIDLADAACRGRGDRPAHLVQRHEAEGRLARAAVVETVTAPDVAAGPADLDPEVVEVSQLDGRRARDRVHLKYRTFYVNETHALVASAGAPRRGRHVRGAHRTRTAPSVAACPRSEMASRVAQYRIRGRRRGDGQSARTTGRRAPGEDGPAASLRTAVCVSPATAAASDFGGRPPRLHPVRVTRAHAPRLLAVAVSSGSSCRSRSRRFDRTPVSCRRARALDSM